MLEGYKKGLSLWQLHYPQMVSLLPLLAIACSFLLVHAQNHTALIESLSQIQGLTYVYGGQAYDSARQACMSVNFSP